MGREWSLLICYLIAGIMCLISPIVASIYLASTAYFFMGLNNNSARIIVRTIFMENIPNKIMGRVQTILGVYTRLMVLLSSLYAGWLVENQSIFIGMVFSFFHYGIAFIGVLTLRSIFKKNSILAATQHA